MTHAPRLPLGESELTLSGVLHAQAPGETHVPLASALELSLDVTRLVATTHDKGAVVGVLDAAHLVCKPGGALSLSSAAGNPLAPELTRGEKPDRLSDVYALGALIYRLLSGRKVDPKRLIEPPSHFNPCVIPELDELVLEALEEDPSERPYSARALEQRLLEVFSELGLEPGDRAEAKKLLEPQPKPKPTAKRVAGIPAPVVQDEDDDEFSRPVGGVKQFLYDLGWVKQQHPAATRARQPERDEDEPSRSRNRLSQFFYDLGWLQNIDWDAPETLTWVKRGGIGLAVLLALIIVWPSSKKDAKPTTSQALVAESLRPKELKPVVKSAAVPGKLVASSERKSGKR